jgi:hypothetical protein
VSESPQSVSTDERKPHYTLKALLGLGWGAVLGALVGVFILLVVLGGAASWNDRGSITGGNIGDRSFTFGQTLTLVFAAGGAVIGGACGSITGLIMAFCRRPPPPNKDLQPKVR